jgi:hypothetical protein
MMRRVVATFLGGALLLAVSGCTPMNYVTDSGKPVTRVVLEAAPADGGDASFEAMSKAAKVLGERLATGERRVRTIAAEGSTVTMDVLGPVGEEDHPLLTEPGELAFRPVLALDGEDPGEELSELPGVDAGVVCSPPTNARYFPVADEWSGCSTMWHGSSIVTMQVSLPDGSPRWRAGAVPACR